MCKINETINIFQHILIPNMADDNNDFDSLMKEAYGNTGISLERSVIIRLVIPDLESRRTRHNNFPQAVFAKSVFSKLHKIIPFFLLPNLTVALK